MAFGFADIIKWGLARLTGAQVTAGGTAVPALTAGNALLDASGATVLTKSGTSTAFPGAVSANSGGPDTFTAATNAGKTVLSASRQLELAPGAGWGLTLLTNSSLGYLFAGTAGNVSLVPEAANVWSQRNGSTGQPQTYRLERGGDGGANRGYTDLRQDATSGFILDSVNTGTVAAPTNILDVRSNGTSRLVIPTSNSAVMTIGINNSILQIANAVGVNYFTYGLFNLANGMTLAWHQSSIATQPDVGLTRSAAGLLELNNSTTGQFRDLRLRSVIASGTSRVIPVPVGSLPSASASGAGAEATVNDALSPAWGATVAGGGSVTVGVRSDGTNWIVF